MIIMFLQHLGLDQNVNSINVNIMDYKMYLTSMVFGQMESQILRVVKR